VLTNDEHDGYSQYDELGADPGTPGTNQIRLYAKDSAGVSTLFYKSDSGTVYELPTITTGGGSAAPSNAEYVTFAAHSKLSAERVLGTAVIMAGTAASRPAAATAGRLYYSTDSGVLERDTSSAWVVIGASAHGQLSGLVSGDPHTQYLLESTATTKGDLLAATGSAAITRLPVGTNGHVLTADSGEATGIKWAAAGAGALDLDDLGDVNAPTPTNGDVLTWDSTPGEWVAQAPTGGGADLDDLTDVNAPTPSNGDVLTWDSTPGEWVALAPGAASLDLDDLTDVALGTPSDGDVLTYDSGGATWSAQAAAAGPSAAGLALFGDGSDGDVTISATTNISRDMFYDDLTVNSGQVLYNTAGAAVPTGQTYRIFVRGTCTVNGTIKAGGQNATSTSGSGGTSVGTLGASASGGNGGTTTGTVGSSSSSRSLGGAGGAGGAGASGAGGGAGSRTLPAAADGMPRMVPSALTGATWNGNQFTGGAGGGGGGGDGTAGGGGGAGGGVLVLVARTIVVGATGVITAAGGTGFTPAAGNRGGGGGGGGGLLILVYNSLTNSGSITVAGGTHGNGTGTGVNGSDGSAGTLIELANA
jgi:hypothetical protein